MIGTRRFTKAQVEAIRSAPPGCTNTSLARQYECSVETISRIRRGLSYRNVTAISKKTSDDCPCPICRRQREPLHVGEAPAVFVIHPRQLLTFRQLAREFDELSGTDRWLAEDFVDYIAVSAVDARPDRKEAA